MQMGENDMYDLYSELICPTCVFPYEAIRALF